jgi:hypothetical protein
LYVFFLILSVFITYTTSRSVRRVMRPLLESPEKLHAYVQRYRIIATAVTFGVLAVFWLIAYSGGSIELDRHANRATMRAKFTAFLPAETGSVPLSAVGQAMLDAKPNAKRIRLVTNNGEDLSFPLWTDRAGQAEAVRAINRFLGR